MRKASLAATLAALALAAPPAAAFAEEALAPSPKAVIYPGDVIRDDMLTDVPQGGARDSGGPFVTDRAFVVGKAARLTPPAGPRDPLCRGLYLQARRRRRRGEARLRRGRPLHRHLGRGAAGRFDRRLCARAQFR